MRRLFAEDELQRLRDVPLLVALAALGRHVAIDRAFAPVKDTRTERWLVDSGAGKAELLVTGAKWFDSRERKGGGGPIDLVMHLDNVSFVEAVRRLKRGLV
jgi:hypothetical protein